MGRSMVENEFKKYSRTSTEAQRSEIVLNVATKFGFNNSDDFYNAIGYGGVAVSKVFYRIKGEFDRVVKPEEQVEEKTPEEAIQIVDKPKNLKSNSGIIVDGESGCMVKFAKCCNPLPGDRVVGFITKGYGISIHKCDCPNVESAHRNGTDATRWVEAHWENSGRSNDEYEAMLQVVAFDRIGMLADISVALADMRVSILQVNTTARSDDQTTINIKISCKNIDHFSSIVSRISSLKDVINVTRGYM